MLNLRQLNKADNTQTTSDAHHFSRFSMDFRVSSDVLGNIGESLDHGQSERQHEDEPEDHEAAADHEQPGGARDLENNGLVGGPSGPRWVDESNSGPLETSRLVAGPSASETRSDEANLRGAAPNAELLGIRGGEVGDTPCQSCDDAAEPFGMDVAERLRYVTCFADGCITSKADRSY